jgi:isoleucyl-tRNA synthetase
VTDQANKPIFRDVSARVNSDELERSVLDFWEKEKIFEKSLERHKEKELFTFYDGPPYATGKPHYGHILQSSIKDTVLRYKTMRGYYVPRRVGWDTHGLPIENIVEKELGITSKREIEDDIEGFNKKCRETVHRYVNEFTATLRRIGRWADYDNAYSTLDRDYMESEWWVFRQLWDQDLVYKSFKTTAFCIRCATPLSNFEVSMNYKDTVDTAVYVLLPVVGKENAFLLVWTTTPWTLPGNAAVAVSPDLEYVTVRHEDKHIIVAKDRVEAVFGADAEIEATWTPESLYALTYKPLYEVELPEEEKADAFAVVPSDHVTADDGTGLVHIAPAFGEEDALLGKEFALPVIRTVDALGTFMDTVSVWAGQNIFEANKAIVRDLKEKQLLLKQEQYKHSYPFCWRCDTPLIYYALDSWFVKVTDLKNQMLKTNEDIHWVPEHVKHGRFAKGIASAPDWAVSRNRFWSVPIPVWECDACDERVCVGSIQELQELSGASDKQLEDIHRPYVDDIVWQCTKCSGTMRRISEVLDVWFDSGSMPYSQWHYPFDNKEFVEQGYPADFIAESIEMTRAWFYVLHVLAAALTRKDIGLGNEKPAYTNVIASGLIFAEDGRKLSKKLKNYPEPEPTIEQYGADVLRFYLLTSTSLGEPYRFSERDLRHLRQNTYVTLWNVYSFFVRYANVHGWQSKQKTQESKNILDRWILARVKQLEHAVMEETDAYRIDTAARLFIPFVDDLSNWYVRRSRSRFHPAHTQESNGQKTEEALATLHEVLVRTAKLLAPFMPFLAEEMFQNLTKQKSVHLEMLDEPAEVVGEEQTLLDMMSRTRRIVSLALATRAKEGIKVRQPLRRLTVKTDKELLDDAVEMIRDEVNVDEVQVDMTAPDALPPGNIITDLDTEITEELKERGIAREIIRHGQVLRRKAGYALNDRITLIVSTEDKLLRRVLDTQKETIMAALQADKVVSEGQEDVGEELTIGKAYIHVGVCR